VLLHHLRTDTHHECMCLYMYVCMRVHVCEHGSIRPSLIKWMSLYYSYISHRSHPLEIEFYSVGQLVWV
jgi:hypothetical protein